MCLRPTWWNRTLAFIVVVSLLLAMSWFTGAIAKRKTLKRGKGRLFRQFCGCWSCAHIWLSLEQTLTLYHTPYYADSLCFWAHYCSVFALGSMLHAFYLHALFFMLMNKSITRLILYRTGFVLFILFEFDLKAVKHKSIFLSAEYFHQTGYGVCSARTYFSK